MAPLRVAKVEEEIRGFSQLQHGWNSDRAPQISESAIKFALAVVDVVNRRRAPLPSAAPTPLGGVALTWDLGEFEAQLLIDDESFDYSYARRAHPKVLDHGSLKDLQAVEARFIERYVVHPIKS